VQWAPLLTRREPVHSRRLIFAQVVDVLPLAEFRACMAHYQGNYTVRGFSCLDQFPCLAFAQLAYRESLRDIETCLRAMQRTRYQMGIRGDVAWSTWPVPTRSETGASWPPSPRFSPAWFNLFVVIRPSLPSGAFVLLQSFQSRLPLPEPGSPLMGDTFFRVELRDSVYIALVEDYFDRVSDDSNAISHWQPPA